MNDYDVLRALYIKLTVVCYFENDQWNQVSFLLFYLTSFHICLV